MDKVIVGTFHKTGTLLIREILRTACARLGYAYWQIQKDAVAAPAGWQVGHQNISVFPQVALEDPYRGAVVIRDPRDVVISGAHYHCRATEAWLFRPEERWDGRCYQEVIAGLPTDEERFLFEMANIGKFTIDCMLDVVRRRPEFLVVRFEELTTDPGMQAFRGMFAHLGFPEQDLPTLLRIAERRSLFSGKVKPSVHVRSGQPAQWTREFTPRVIEEFERLFPGAAEALGYEPSSLAALHPA